uniref:Uncharacterized protein n=1 Tax=viral metagenome TaxID=1070528 RepID=A0A6C0KMQ2_9ZZZZ
MINYHNLIVFLGGVYGFRNGLKHFNKGYLGKINFILEIICGLVFAYLFPILYTTLLLFL